MHSPDNPPNTERAPHMGTRAALDYAASHHLVRLLSEESVRVSQLRNTARRLMGSAIAAYVRTRHKGASTIA